MLDAGQDFDLPEKAVALVGIVVHVAQDTQKLEALHQRVADAVGDAGLRAADNVDKFVFADGLAKLESHADPLADKALNTLSAVPGFCLRPVRKLKRNEALECR